MALVVQKFGGTSVGTPERIQAVAARVAKRRAAGDDVVVVVSAMSGETNRLIALGGELSKHPPHREMDTLTSTGEQVSASLMAIALCEIGCAALSLTGHQTRILTDGVYLKARIRSIDVQPMRDSLAAGKVPVIAGFQGLDEVGNITTLGRGGTDTTAVALAAALNADVCEIYTDVDGVYTTDPNVCPKATKIPAIAFDEMLELASLGAKVLQIRSVEVAMKYGIPIHVRSSFTDTPGTIVGGEDLESVVVRGVACDRNEVKVTIRALPDEPGVVARVFESLSTGNVSVDIIVQVAAHSGHTDLTFTVTQTDLQATEEITKLVAAEIGAGEVTLDSAVSKVSIVGAGMRSHVGVAAQMFRMLADGGINIQAITTSEIRVSCLVASDQADSALRILHAGFGLEQPEQK